MESPMGQTLEAMVCPHGMPNPATCVDCMAEGRFLPRTARKARSTEANVGGYTVDNDCTVQAIVNALGVSWVEATTALREQGWVPGQGTSALTVSQAVEHLGFTMTATSLTLAGAVADSGTFIVVGFRSRTNGHAWVVENGRHVNGLGWERPGRRTMRYRVFRLS